MSWHPFIFNQVKSLNRIYDFYGLFVLILALLDHVFKDHTSDSVEVKDVKKAIIKTLLESDTSQDIFNEDILSRVKAKTNAQNRANLYPEELSVDSMAV